MVFVRKPLRHKGHRRSRQGRDRFHEPDRGPGAHERRHLVFYRTERFAPRAASAPRHPRRVRLGDGRRGGGRSGRSSGQKEQGRSVAVNSHLFGKRGSGSFHWFHWLASAAPTCQCRERLGSSGQGGTPMKIWQVTAVIGSTFSLACGSSGTGSNPGGEHGAASATPSDSGATSSKPATGSAATGSAATGAADAGDPNTATITMGTFNV